MQCRENYLWFVAILVYKIIGKQYFLVVKRENALTSTKLMALWYYKYNGLLY